MAEENNRLNFLQEMQKDYLVAGLNEKDNVPGTRFNLSESTNIKGIRFRNQLNNELILDLDNESPKENNNYEVHFFDTRLVDVIDTLLKNSYHVIASGLMLDFRGEPFGPTPWLIGRANEITRLTAICDVFGCNRRATRTQRLINGDPAPYNSPLVVIEDQGKIETYEARCIIHHIVPKKGDFL